MPLVVAERPHAVLLIGEVLAHEVGEEHVRRAARERPVTRLHLPLLAAVDRVLLRADLLAELAPANS